MPHRTLKKWCRLAERDWPLGTSMAQMRVEVWVWTQEERWNCNKHMLKPCEVNTEDASETEQSQLLIRKMKWWWHPLQTREKVSLQPLLMKDLSPELTSNTHYRTLKWLQCLYFSVYIKDQGAATASKHFRDWLWVNVLMQRCLWLKEMSCPAPLHGAYITERRAMDPGGINRKKSIT